MCDSSLLLKNPPIPSKHLSNQKTFKPNVPVAGAATHSPSKPCLLSGQSGALNSGQKKKEGELKYHFQARLIQTVPQDLLRLLLPIAEQRIL